MMSKMLMSDYEWNISGKNVKGEHRQKVKNNIGKSIQQRQRYT